MSRNIPASLLFPCFFLGMFFSSLILRPPERRGTISVLTKIGVTSFVFQIGTLRLVGFLSVSLIAHPKGFPWKSREQLTNRFLLVV